MAVYEKRGEDGGRDCFPEQLLSPAFWQLFRFLCVPEFVSPFWRACLRGRLTALSFPTSLPRHLSRPPLFNAYSYHHHFFRKGHRYLNTETSVGVTTTDGTRAGRGSAAGVGTDLLQIAEPAGGWLRRRLQTSQVGSVLGTWRPQKVFLRIRREPKHRASRGGLFGGWQKWRLQNKHFGSAPANYSAKILVAECLLLCLQIDFICTTCAHCCCMEISSFYEVISHILIALTEGALVVNTVTPCKNNMLCPFLILEICNILRFKIHKVSA